MQHKISLARAVYSRSKTVLIDDVFHTLGKLSSTFIYENCIRGDLMRDRTVIVVTTWPDMFWARDARLLVHLTLSEDNKKASVDAMESDPEKMVALIKQRRKSLTKVKLDQEQQQYQVVGDVIDTLFEHVGHPTTKAASTLFEQDEQDQVDDEEDEFDHGSVIPDSIMRAHQHEDEEDDEEQEEEVDKRSRDYAYTTYYAACGGWKYWTFAVVFTLLARLTSISESYWLKEGNPFFTKHKILK